MSGSALVFRDLGQRFNITCVEIDKSCMDIIVSVTHISAQN